MPTRRRARTAIIVTEAVDDEEENEIVWINTSGGSFDDENNWDLGRRPDTDDTTIFGLPNDQDNCPSTPNPDQADADADGVGDVCAPPPPPMLLT